ncbi:MAG: hypothetical protein K2Y27_11470 [Xanthobacteraceae bacterium]|nr:hypothetical protein [Xanthobacteraceae bacterium]
MIANMDLARSLGPNVIVMSGWVIADATAPLRWRLVSSTGDADISSAVYTFARPDLVQSNEYLLMQGQGGTGFLAVVYGEWGAIEDWRLSIGTSDDPSQADLPLVQYSDTTLEQFFFNAWQPVRLKLLNTVSNLPDTTEYAAVHEQVEKLAANWANEISLFEHKFSPKTSAGIEHRARTPDGQFYVEGWAMTPPNVPKAGISACLIGLRGGQVHVFQSAFRRPDLPNAPTAAELAPGFAIISQGTLSPSAQSATMIIEAQVGDEIGYSKILLQPRNSTEFTQLFWTRVLDPQTALDNIVTSIVGTINRHLEPKAELMAAPQSAAGDFAIELIVHGLDSQSHLTHMLRLSLANLSLAPARVGAVLPDSTQFDPVWMIGAAWHRVELSACLKSCFGKLAGERTHTLLLDACCMLDPGFEADLQAANDLLAADPRLLAVALAPTDMTMKRDSLVVSQKVRGRYGKRQRGAFAEATLCLNRGNSVPPLLVRAGALRAIAGQLWTSPLSTLDVRRLIRALPPHALGILETPNVAVFFNSARPLSLSREQSASIHNIFWWR